MITRKTGVTKESSEAWKNRRLLYKLRRAQRKILKIIQESKGRKIVIHCSRRLGKSFLLCLLAIIMCLSKPDAAVRYAAPTQKAVRNIIHPIIKQILNDCPMRLRPKWNSMEGAYQFKNGSVLQVAGANNNHEDDLRGTDADLCIVDEAGFIDRLSYLVDAVLMPQLINTQGLCIMSSSSPVSPAHEFVDYINKAKLEDSYAIFDIYEAEYSEERIEEFCKEAGGYASTVWEREYLCKLVVDKDFAIIPEYKKDYEIDTPKDQLYGCYHKYVAMDMGRVDLTALVFGYYDFRKAALIVEDELTMQGPTWTTETLKNECFAKERELWGEQKPYRRIADNNNPHMILDLGYLHGLHFVETNKESLESMVNEVREMVNDGRILIHPRCKMLLGCLEFGFWAVPKKGFTGESRKGFGRSKVFGHFDHLAALIYLVRNLDRHTNPIPVGFGLDSSRAFIRANGLSENARVLESLLLNKGKR